MTIEKREYDYGDGRVRKVEIHHGASESFIISDTDWPKEHDSWGQPLKKNEKKFKWFNPDPIENLEREILK